MLYYSDQAVMHVKVFMIQSFKVNSTKSESKVLQVLEHFPNCMLSTETT